MITITHLLATILLYSHLSSLQDALSSFDFLNKRHSTVIKPDLDGELEQEIPDPDLELTTIQKVTDIRYAYHVFVLS